MSSMIDDLRAAKAAREAKAAAGAKMLESVKALGIEPDAVETDPIRNIEQYADRELENERGLFQASW
jgi:hypothetical protein